MNIQKTRTWTGLEWAEMVFSGQLSTRLRDANGVEIFEGDIVAWPNNALASDENPREIVWKDGMLTYKDTWYDSDGMWYPEECVVIGNTTEGIKI